MTRRVFAWLAAGLLPLSAGAHIGNPTTIHEGLAGPVPVRVSVRVPSVVPGLADINVRVFTNGVTRVTVLPVHWKTGLEGSPAPDVCVPVPGEPNLYHAQLWLMARGAYSVNVAVESAAGAGKIVVPINSLATTRLPLSTGLGAILGGIGVFLFALAVTAAGAACRESVLEPGVVASKGQIWTGRLGVVFSSILLAMLLYAGWSWWQTEDRDYRNNRMHKPLPVLADVVVEGGRQILRLSGLSTNQSGSATPGLSFLVPDHGKLMHLFLVREPDMESFAHLHPVRRAKNVFECSLPRLPGGTYSVYADVTYDSGLSQTLTATTLMPESDLSLTAPAVLTDPDDSWRIERQESGELGDGYKMVWERGGTLYAGRETSLRFRVLDAKGDPAEIEPYINMLAHAIVRRDDGAVFTHLHPAGTISVAAQQVFQLRAGEKTPRRITPEQMEKLCASPGPEMRLLPIAFPYEFPQPGRYRLWVQVKVAGTVRTGVFDTEVKPAG